MTKYLRLIIRQDDEIDEDGCEWRKTIEFLYDINVTHIVKGKFYCTVISIIW